MKNISTGLRAAACLAAALSLAGCEAIALSALGVGGSTAVNHTLTGMTYRTFTAPLPRVKNASVGALSRMGIRVASSERTEGNEVLKANAKDRQIEIVLEPVNEIPRESNGKFRAVISNLPRGEVAAVSSPR